MSTGAVLKRSRTAISAAVCATVLAGWVCWEGTTLVAADWRSSQARLTVTRWVQGQQPWDAERARSVEADLRQAIAWVPDDTTLIESLALLYTVRGQQEWGDGSADSPGVAHYRKALALQKQSLALRPLQGSSWANLALMHYAADDSVEETFDAWRKGLQYGPNEPEVRQVLMSVAKLAWQAAPQDVLDWLEAQEPGALKALQTAEKAAQAAASAASAASAAKK